MKQFSLILLILVASCSEEAITPEPRKIPTTGKNPAEETVAPQPPSDPESRKLYDHLLSTDWAGPIGSGESSGRLRFTPNKVELVYAWIMQSLPGEFEIEKERLSLSFEGSIHSHRTQQEEFYHLNAECLLKGRTHPFDYQIYLECHWTKKCENGYMLCESLPDSTKFYDQNSSQSPGEDATIDGVKAITVEPVEKKTIMDAYIRVAPSVNAQHLTNLESCIGGTPEKYEAGSTFLILARTPTKTTLLEKSDYWYYGVYSIADCASGWGERGWIFGGLLE